MPPNPDLISPHNYPPLQGLRRWCWRLGRWRMEVEFLARYSHDRELNRVRASRTSCKSRSQPSPSPTSFRRRSNSRSSSHPRPSPTSSRRHRPRSPLRPPTPPATPVPPLPVIGVWSSVTTLLRYVCLRKRLDILEKAKVERRIATKYENKQATFSGTGPSSRPAKVGRTANAPYALLRHNGPASHQTPTAWHSYNYPSQIQRITTPYGGCVSISYGDDYAAPLSAPAQAAYPHQH